MRAPEIIGQDEVVRLLDRELLTGKMSHSYLMWGPRGSGRSLLAQRLALAANCTGDPKRALPLAYCGLCSDCMKIIEGVHPDFSVISPEGDSIKISQIREMQQRIGLKANEARFKTWVIDDAERMTEEAQNCLLKVLEEPPGDALIILVAESPSMLLPTVSSRCHRVRLRTVPADVLTPWLREQYGLPEDRARFLAVLSGGLPGRASSLAVDEEYFSVRDFILSTVREVMGCRDGGRVLSASEDILDRLKKVSSTIEGTGTESELMGISTPRGVCSIIAGWYRDLYAYGSTGDPELVINSDYLPSIQHDAETFDPSVFSGWAAHAMHTARALASSANARLALDELFLDLALLR